MEQQNSNSIVVSKAFVSAWAIGLGFYFIIYVIRSCPAVMIGQLAGHFGTSAVGVSSIIGSYYYAYAIISLVAGMALDHFGGRSPVAIGLIMLSIGCLLFILPAPVSGYVGRILQGAGSAFGFTGCVYLATHGFSSRFTATAIGITQCIGMSGGAAGQFVVGGIIKGMEINTFWALTAAACTIICVIFFLITPRENTSAENAETFDSLLHPFKIVFKNSQSYLCGVISGLLFAPTTVFVMTWGVAFFQKDRGFDYDTAVITCAMAPLGWVIGCPLLGWISDRINSRKYVLTGGIVLMIISFTQMVFAEHLLSVHISMLVFGIASGAAMIPYSMIKEANPPEVKGSATGAMNFLTFSVTALIGPFFGKYLGKTLGSAADPGAHFQMMGLVILSLLVLALVASFIIRETTHTAKLLTKNIAADLHYEKLN